jgi:hypothetical protein
VHVSYAWKMPNHGAFGMATRCTCVRVKLAGRGVSERGESALFVTYLPTKF